MKRLTETEIRVLTALHAKGSICVGERPEHGRSFFATEIVAALDSLVKKKRATVEMTDDGPRYHAA